MMMQRPRPRRAVLTAVLCSLLLPAAAGASATDDPYRLGDAVTPTFESIRLKLNADETDYTGSVRIDLRLDRPVSSFRLHAEEMDLKSVTITGAGETRDLTWETGKTGLVTVIAPRPLTPGSWTLAIDFANDFGTRAVGLYRMEQDGAGYAFTQFESDDAREAFPCFDEPAFKIPYQITLEIPAAHIAVSNTPVEKETVKDGLKTVVFARTKPLPSYLLAIATGPFETVPIPGMGVPGRVVTVKGHSGLAGTAASLAAPILAALEKYFGRKYPYEKLDLIAVPDYWPGAMENPGAITFAEPLLLVDPASVSVAQKRTLARVTAHEMAHMWFGDLVTLAWWDDLWLNESFADWMGDKITQQVHPEFNLELTELQSIQQTMMGDARPSSEAIRREVPADSNKMQGVGLAYDKGKAVLGMFERWVGEETFRKGVLAYIEENEWGNARASDLWSALSKASGLDVKLSSAMTTFLEQPGLPIVDVGLAGDGKLKLTQRRYLGAGAEAPDQRWEIPVEIRYSDGRTVRTASVLLAGTETTVELPGGVKPVWVMPDAEGRGYYRWNVPPDMLQAMSREATTSLDPRERIAMVGNLSALLTAGSLHGDEYLRALGHLADDPEPQVMSSVAAAITGVREEFVPDDLEEAFARYVRTTLGPALSRFGLEKKPGEDEAVSLFRPQLVGILGMDGNDTRILDHGDALARRYMADTASVDPAMAGIALQLAAVRGDAKLFGEYRRRIEAASTPDERSRYLSACGAFRDPEVIEQVLAYSLSGPLRSREIFQVIGGIGRTAAGRDRLYRFVTGNYDAITGRLPAEFAAFMPFAAGGCELDRLAAARKFFAEPEHDKPGTAKTLSRVADQVEECAGLRSREGASAAAFLKDFGGAAAGVQAADAP